MVIISGSPLEYDTFKNEFAPNSVERSILDKLYMSNEKYNYDSLNFLRFELMLRREIVKASIDLYKSGMAFEVFRKSRCNDEFWERTQEGGFVLKNGIKASDAINDIFAHGSKYGTECATAMIIVYYKALLNIFPVELFNKLFTTIHLMNWHYIDRALREVGYTKIPEVYLPGDRRYFKNPDVDPLTPEWQGENTIDLDNGLYYGHGIGITTADEIIDALNNNRKEDANESAYLLGTVSLPNFKNLANIYYRYIAAD